MWVKGMASERAWHQFEEAVLEAKVDRDMKLLDAIRILREQLRCPTLTADDASRFEGGFDDASVLI